MIRVLAAIACAIAGACGGTAKPKGYDTAKLARTLHADLVTLADIAKRHRGDCPALIAALDPHVTAMRAHADEVKRVQQDPALATQLRRDVAAYDRQHQGLAEAIGSDLGASYQHCPDDRQLLRAIDRIPVL